MVQYLRKVPKPYFAFSVTHGTPCFTIALASLEGCSGVIGMNVIASSIISFVMGLGASFPYKTSVVDFRVFKVTGATHGFKIIGK